MSETQGTAAIRQYLTFFVAREEYAIEVLRVREVVAAMPITRVPSVPRDVRGVVNLRGSVVPVVDLGLRFGGPGLTPTVRTCIVVVESNAEDVGVVGLLVDSVNRVVTLAPDQIEPVPPFGTQVTAELLGGVGVVEQAFVLILVPDRVARIRDRVEAATL
jgi:purine-binding chemotaxis protein CheW